MNQSNPLSALEEIQKTKAYLENKLQAAKASAIAHVQEIIDAFNIQPTDVRFKRLDGRKRPPVKYRLPNGETWTGKGCLPNSFKKFLEEHNFSRSDLDHFLTERFKK